MGWEVTPVTDMPSAQLHALGDVPLSTQLAAGSR